MKTIRFTYILTLAFLSILSTSAYAQVDGTSESRSGSFYSLFGLGYPTDQHSARELGMGILGVSLNASQSNTLQNPALWGGNALTTASTGFNLSRFGVSNGVESNTNALLETGYFQLTLPISRGKLGVSASMYSVTRSNYRFVNFDSTVVNAENTVNYASDIRGDGGINRLEVGLGWKINDHISIGYAPSLTFISQNNNQYVFFEQAGYRSSNLESKITGSAMGHRFGTLITLNKIFTGRDRLTIGTETTLPITIDAQKENSVFKIVNQSDQKVILGEVQKGEVKLPFETKAGFTYYPSQLVNISVEGLYEGWSKFETPFDPVGESYSTRDRVKVGFGAEYHPYRTNSSKFLSNFRYGGGITYDSGHLTVNNRDINTLWFSAGLGIISPRSNSSVDLSIRYGLRGETTDNLIKENIWSFNLSVNLSELMFFRQKLK